MVAMTIKFAKTIRDLPRGHYPWIMAEIKKQSDRPAAIVGASYVDLALRAALEQRLTDIPDVVYRLFEDNGPLQSFSARIYLGFALGIYKRRAFNDLRLVRDIRNAFAHSVEPITFAYQDVGDLCNLLWLPKNISMANHPDPISPRDIYIRAVEWLIDGLFQETHRGRLVYPDPLALNYDAPGPRPSSRGKSPRQRPSRGQTRKQTNPTP